MFLRTDNRGSIRRGLTGDGGVLPENYAGAICGPAEYVRPAATGLHLFSIYCVEPSVQATDLDVEPFNDVAHGLQHGD